MLLKAKRDYYSARIAYMPGDQRALFRETAKLLNRNTLQKWPSHPSLDDLANKFAECFEDKILKIRDCLAKATQELGGSSCSSTKKCSSNFSDFIPVSHDDIRKILMSSASKSCPLDTMPTTCTILNDCLDVILGNQETWGLCQWDEVMVGYTYYAAVYWWQDWVDVIWLSSQGNPLSFLDSKLALRR